MDKIKSFISRKFLVAVLTPILLYINAQLANPLDPDAVRNIVLVVIAYLLGQSAVDIVTETKKGK